VSRAATAVVLGAVALLAIAWTAPRTSEAVAAWVRTEHVRTRTMPIGGGLAVAPASKGVVTIDAGAEFTMLGLTCDLPPDDGLVVRLRTSRDGHEWSPWYETPLEVAGENGEAAQAYTDALWTGDGHYVQLAARAAEGRPARRLSGVRLVALDTEGDGAPLQTALRGVRRLVATVAGLRLTAPASAAVSEPAWVTRAGWGADESLRSGSVATAPVKMAFVHHTAGGNTYAREDAPAVVRGIYAYHTQTLGWNDIGYNFLVDRFGTIYVGRAGGPRQGVVGAHTYGFNTGSTGVSVMGTYTSAAPPAAATASLEHLLAWKLGLHGVGPEGTATMTCGASEKHTSGQTVTFPVIAGHRDANYTVCPGDAFYAALATLRAQVAARMQHASAVPQPWSVTLSLPAANVTAGTEVTYSGTVKRADGASGSGTATVQKRAASGGSWTDWRTVKLDAKGAYGVTVRMVNERVWQFRTRMVGGGASLTAYSPVRELRVTAPKPWVVTLTLPATAVQLDEVVAYSGTVRSATGAPGAGRVTVQKRPASGGTWADWRTATLDPEGAYSVSVKMVNPRSWRFRARMAADTANLTGTSGVCGLRVGPPVPWVVTLRLSDERVRANATVRYSGTVRTSIGAPAASGQVAVQKRLAAGGPWRTWRTATLDDKGAYALSVRMTTRPRDWHFRTRMLADADNLTAFSEVRDLRVD
jgi:hypothetical protein